MRRVPISSVLLLCLSASLLTAAPATAAGTVGDFEIDGDVIDNPAGGPIDWDTALEPIVDLRLDFTDEFKSKTDDSFGKGSKEEEPGGWTCSEGGVPAKDDITAGAIAFRVVDGQQFAYVNWTRLSSNGDAHIDYEFNQTAVSNPNCPETPLRADGDILITYDTDVSKKTITVAAYVWQFDEGTTATGHFTPLGAPVEHVTFDAATSPDLLFGEGSVNLTNTIGTIECGEFAGVYMKSRASTSINAALKDRTKQEGLDGLCPELSLEKTVSPTSATTGDTVTYTITVQNTGQVAGETGAIVDDYDQAHIDPVAATIAPNTGADNDDTITWPSTSVPPGGTLTFTYQATVIGTYTGPPGSAGDDPCQAGESEYEVRNTVTAGDLSDEAILCVHATPDISIAKDVQPATAAVGDTVHYTVTVTNNGDAEGTTSAIVDDYDEAHIDPDGGTISPDSGNDDGDTITWPGVTLAPAGGSATFTYSATVIGTYTGETGGAGCAAGLYPVMNTATVDGESDSAVLCVNAGPTFVVTKSVSPTTAQVGDTVTYTITVTNNGPADGTTTSIVDDYDEAHIDPVATTITPGTGVDDGDTITWPAVTLAAAGGSATFTYDATVVGTFSGAAGTGNCSATNSEYAVINTVSVSDQSASAELCVEARPEFQIAKDVQPGSAAVGDTVSYTITVTNVGDAEGTSPSVVDDYDEAHLDPVAGTIAPDTGVDDGDTIAWPGVTLAAGGSATFTYDATVVGTFSGEPGADGCGASEFPVYNTASVGAESATAKLCVLAGPEPTITKAATTVGGTEPGSTITFTIAFGNTGNADAGGVTVVDTIPAGTAFDDCTGPTGAAGDCDQSGLPDSVSWSIGTIPAGSSGSVTLTVELLPTVGCEVCNQATLTMTGHEAITSNEACVDTQAGPRPDLATANGSAFGVHVHDTFPAEVIAGPLPTSSSSRSGVGPDQIDADQVASVAVPPPPEEEVTAEVLRTTSRSAVSDLTNTADQTSTAESVNVTVHDGLITAEFVRGVATARATGSSSSTSTTGSTFKNLVIDGVPYAESDIAPNTRIDLPEALFGAGSYVMLFEQVGPGATFTPGPTPLSGGIYAADLTVNMIRVHITDQAVLLPGDQPLDVTVASATAHADFPQTTICEEPASQAVHGHAFTLSASGTTSPASATLVDGLVRLPASGLGGHDHQQANSAAIPADGSTASSGTAVTDTLGTLGDTSSDASSVADTETVCLLPGTPGDLSTCTVYAQVARTESNTSATALGASSNDGDGDGDGDTVVLGLAIASVSHTVDPAPNQRIEVPGVGFLLVNEQLCDNNGTLANGCADGDLAGTAGLTVRALRLVVTVGALAGAEIIVGESYSSARFA